jgi:hypothetical protein
MFCSHTFTPIFLPLLSPPPPCSLHASCTVSTILTHLSFVDMSAGSASVGLSGAPSSATSAFDAFMDMSADTLAAAAAGGSSLRHSSSGAGAAAAAAAAPSAAGFERYGLEHPAAAADAAEQQQEEEDGQQQQRGLAKVRVKVAAGAATTAGGCCCCCRLECFCCCYHAQLLLASFLCAAPLGGGLHLAGSTLGTCGGVTCSGLESADSTRPACAAAQSQQT